MKKFILPTLFVTIFCAITGLSGMESEQGGPLPLVKTDLFAPRDDSFRTYNGRFKALIDETPRWFVMEHKRFPQEQSPFLNRLLPQLNIYEGEYFDAFSPTTMDRVRFRAQGKHGDRSGIYQIRMSGFDGPPVFNYRAKGNIETSRIEDVKSRVMQLTRQLNGGCKRGKFSLQNCLVRLQFLVIELATDEITTTPMLGTQQCMSETIIFNHPFDPIGFATIAEHKWQDPTTKSLQISHPCIGITEWDEVGGEEMGHAIKLALRIIYGKDETQDQILLKQFQQFETRQTRNDPFCYNGCESLAGTVDPFIFRRYEETDDQPLKLKIYTRPTPEEGAEEVVKYLAYPRVDDDRLHDVENRMQRLTDHLNDMCNRSLIGVAACLLMLDLFVYTLTLESNPEYPPYIIQLSGDERHRRMAVILGFSHPFKKGKDAVRTDVPLKFW